MKFALSPAIFTLYNVRDGVALGPKQLEMLKAAGIDRIDESFRVFHIANTPGATNGDRLKVLGGHYRTDA